MQIDNASARTLFPCIGVGRNFIFLIMTTYYFACVSTNNSCSDRIIIELGVHVMSPEGSIFPVLLMYPLFS
jgi:hypothetical protein